MGWGYRWKGAGRGGELVGLWAALPGEVDGDRSRPLGWILTSILELGSPNSASWSCTTNLTHHVGHLSANKHEPDLPAWSSLDFCQ